MKNKLLSIFILGLALILVGCGSNKQAKTTPAPQATSNQKVGPPTYVKKGKKPRDHVVSYFEAYKNKQYDKAYELQPAVNKAKQTKEQFTNLRKSFPISSYKIGEIVQNGNNQQVIDAEYTIGQYGAWTSRWYFVLKNGRWIAVKYQVLQKQ